MNRSDKQVSVRVVVQVGLLLVAISVAVLACAEARSPTPDFSTPVTRRPQIPSPMPSRVAPSSTSALGQAQLPPPTQLFSLCWVGYSPTSFDPDQGTYPAEESIRQDLEILRAAGFTGLVTYGAHDTLGTVVPRLAQELGFSGLIVGIWDPTNTAEWKHAVAAAEYQVTVGYAVGNEGLGEDYDLATLHSTMTKLRQATGRPVATTEEIGDYSDPTMLTLGDWVFPNAHPFYAGIIEPGEAVEWTERVFTDLQHRSGRPVMLKEVGLPTGGDPRGRLDETVQAEYYGQLRDTEVQFVYFEAFDQPWKKATSVEPFWGLFGVDRTPKKVVQYVCANVPPSPTTAPIPPATTKPATTSTITPTSPLTPAITVTRILTPTGTPQVFDIYTDAEGDKPFSPTGKMGDTGDITVNEAWTESKHSGTSSIKITYSAKGSGPNECPYKPPCQWAGVYWQRPPDNWGTIPNVGIDLRGFRRLTFWARADTEVRVEFKVGGITGKHADSIQPARSSGLLTLSDKWWRFEINLEGLDLSYVIGGFAWAANWDNNGITEGNPRVLVFYLDDIRFEK